MKVPQIPSYILVVLRIAIAMIFIVSGYLKLIEPHQNFMAVIETYEVVNPQIAELVAKVFPWLELIMGVFLLWGIWLKHALICLWAMCSVFIGVVGQALVRKLPLSECGCFGELLSMPPQATFVMDLFLWACFAAMYYYSGRTATWGLDPYFKNKKRKSKR